MSIIYCYCSIAIFIEMKISQEMSVINWRLTFRGMKPNLRLIIEMAAAHQPSQIRTIFSNFSKTWSQTFCVIFTLLFRVISWTINIVTNVGVLVSSCWMQYVWVWILICCNDTRVANIMTNDHNTSLCMAADILRQGPTDACWFVDATHPSFEWLTRKERMERSMSHPLNDHQECYCHHIRNLVYHNELSLRKVTLKWDTRFPNTFYSQVSNVQPGIKWSYSAATKMVVFNIIHTMDIYTFSQVFTL